MAEEQGPDGDAEKVPGWWESLGEDDRQEVRDALDAGGDLPARLAISLSRAGIAVGRAQFGSVPGVARFPVPGVVVDHVRGLSRGSE